MQQSWLEKGNSNSDTRPYLPGPLQLTVLD